MHRPDRSESKQVKIIGWGSPEVFLFELINAKGMSVGISNFGAAIVSCRVADRNGVYKDVVLGYDSLEQYETDQFYLGTVVGRYANRIKGERIDIAGESFTISATPGGFHHHGGMVGFNKKLFRAWPFESATQRGVKLSYTSKDGEEGFPGTLEVTVTYTLDDENNLTVEYGADTDKATILNLTQHSYFNLAGHDSGPVEKQKIQILADELLVVDDNFIPTGELRSVEGTRYDLRRSVMIGESIDAPEFAPGMGYDNSWVLKRTADNKLQHAATAEDEATGRVLRVHTTEPSVHFYSANFIVEGTPGKGGTLYGRRHGFCLETQHFPDSPNHPHFPSTLLLPGERFYSRTIFGFGIDR